MRNALDEIASLLAAFFADTDYVGSDILSEFFLKISVNMCYFRIFRLLLNLYNVK